VNLFQAKWQKFQGEIREIEESTPKTKVDEPQRPRQMAHPKGGFWERTPKRARRRPWIARRECPTGNDETEAKLHEL